MNLTVVKFVAKGIVGLGTTYVVNSSVDSLIGRPETLIQKVLVFGGKWGLSGVATYATRSHTDMVVDQLAYAYKENKEILKEAAKEKLASSPDNA